MIKLFNILLKNLKRQTPLDRDFFSIPAHLHDNFELKTPVSHQECHFNIESVGSLKKLLNEMHLNKEEPILRFLVDRSGTAWFARENNPHIKAPKHFQMTGLSQVETCCQTAGNIKFTNSTFKVLKSINHRSGDFHPSFYSLRTFLAILVINEKHLPFKLPKTIVVQELNSEGKTKKKHRWSLADIKAWISTFIENKVLVECLSNQDLPTKQVYYEATL